MNIEFNRDCDSKLIENFKILYSTENDLMKSIKRDIEKGAAFFAFRPKNKIQMYYKGRSIFKTGANTKNIKFNTNRTIVLKDNNFNKNNYINIKRQINEIIKKRKKGKSYREAYQTSALYKFSWCNKSKDFILLDIEPQFNYHLIDKKKHKLKNSRVDAVLFDINSKCLFFVEVKRIEDDRLRKGDKESPKISKEIVTQLNEYKNLIKENKKLILNEYKKVILAINKINNTNYLLDINKNIELAFLVTEYNKDQYKYIKEFKKRMVKELEQNEIKTRLWYIGNVFNVKYNTLKYKWLI